MSNRIGIVHTGTSNLASLRATFDRAGITTGIIKRPKEIGQYGRLVLPGVGSFRSAMDEIDRQQLAQPLRDSIDSGTPLLAICLGMQILFEASEESPGVKGLGILRGHIQQFRNAPRIPHVGWNEIVPHPESRYLTQGYAYFVHSFRLGSTDATVVASKTDYYDTFLSAFEYENILACQFHPELSGQWGEELIARWLQSSRVFPVANSFEDQRSC